MKQLKQRMKHMSEQCLKSTPSEKRKYPDIKVGDKVKLYQKKDKLDKERISVWNKTVYEVKDIKHEKDQEMYYLTNYPKPVLRHELLKVRTWSCSF